MTTQTPGIEVLTPETSLTRGGVSPRRAAVLVYSMGRSPHANTRVYRMAFLYVAQPRLAGEWTISVGDKALTGFPTREGRRSKRVAAKRRASVVLNLGSHPHRVPCLILDSSPEGFRLRGAFRLKHGQVVEVIPEERLHAIRCSVVWIGKRGSKQEGEVGLQAL